MKKFKRILSYVMMIMMVVFLFSGVRVKEVLAGVKTTSKGYLYYSITENDEVTITGYSGTDKKLDIPNEIEGKIVTSIGNSAFGNCSSLTSIIIPNSVTSIGEMAFINCSSLTNITIPDSVTSIEDNTFSSCEKLTNITIPNSVTSIGDDVFIFCYNLTSIIIPNSVTSIGNDVFWGCFDLTIYGYKNSYAETYANNESIPFKEINNSNFLYSITENNEIIITGYSGTDTELFIPNEIEGKPVTSIGISAFEHCEELTSVAISNSVTSIGNWAFSNCSSLRSIIMSNSITSIGTMAFSNCSSLTNITIPDTVTSIGDYAFEFCENLTNITIPDTVTSIGLDAFSNCNSLTSISVDKNNENYVDEEGILFNKNKSLLIKYPEGKKDKSYEIPNTVTSIGESAFYYCSSLTSIIIPNTVTSIGERAFCCSGLTSIIIPNTVISIGKMAFYCCSNLTSIIIPNSITSIGDYTFLGCSNLTSIIIPNSITSIGRNAFSNCNSLTSISVDKNNENYVDEEGILFNKNKSLLIKYPEGKKDKSYEIPDTVTSIGNYAFEDCSSLASVIIPNSVTSIGDYTFEDCSSLASVIIPNSVTSIGDYTFYYCTSLGNIIIPESVTSIGTRAFYGCNNLTIYGYKNSYAETYANKNSIPFKELTVQNLNIESFTTDKTSPQVSGTAVTLTTKANGEGALQYKYYKYLNGNYSLIKDWSSSSSITITPSIAGKYDLWVGVKDESGKIVRKNIEFEFKKVLTINSFTADKTSPQPVNTEVILKTNVSGATGIVQYKYYKYLNGKYSLIKDWSNNSSTKIAPSTAGKYDLWVGVKDESGKTVRKNMEFEFKKVLTINSFTTDKTSPQPINTEITLKTNISGATGTVQYKYYKYVNGTYEVIKDWSNNSSLTLMPTTIGTYDLWVAVKDSTGKIVRKSMKYIIKEQPLKIDSFTTDKISPQEIGTSIKLTVQASGGKGKLQYKFRVGDKDGNYLVIQKFSTNNTATWNADYSGDVIFYVDVEDESGRGVTKAINYAIKEK